MFCCIRKINIKLGSYLVISGTGTFSPFPSQVISLDVEDAKATYYDTLRMAGKVNIDPKYPVLRRRCDPKIIIYGYSKDVWKQIQGKVMFGNGVTWMCLISLYLSVDRRKEYSVISLCPPE